MLDRNSFGSGEYERGRCRLLLVSRHSMMKIEGRLFIPYGTSSPCIKFESSQSGPSCPDELCAPDAKPFSAGISADWCGHAAILSTHDA